MKLHLEAEQTHAERVQAGRDLLKVKNSMDVLNKRAAEFQKAYVDYEDVWYFIKGQILHIVADLRMTTMWASVFKDEIKTKDDLQVFFFDKVFPALKAADFPEPRTPAMHAIFNNADLSKLITST